MIKDLRIIFTKEEKTLENLNRVLEVLGDSSWRKNNKEDFLEENMPLVLVYDDDDDDLAPKGYNFSGFVNDTELSLRDFFYLYDAKPIYSISGNKIKIGENSQPIINSKEDLDDLPVVDTMTEMKKLYATDKYDFYVLDKINGKDYNYAVPEYAHDVIPILKKHSLIAQAVIENPDVEVEQEHSPNGEKNWWVDTVNFLNSYEEGIKYRLKEDTHEFSKVEPKEEIIIFGDTKPDFLDKYKQEALLSKQAHFTEPKETISIEDEERKEHFAKFGFEVPEFECELLKTVKINTISEHEFVGFIKTKDGFTHSHTWLKDGQCIDSSRKPVKKYNLTPISKQWHEDIPMGGIRCLFIRYLKTKKYTEIKTVIRYKTESNQHCVEDADGMTWFADRFKPLSMATEAELNSLHISEDN